MSTTMRIFPNIFLLFLATLFFGSAASAMSASGLSGPVSSYDGNTIGISKRQYPLIQSTKGNNYKSLSCRSTSQLIRCDSLKSFKGVARLTFSEGLVTQVEILDSVK